MPDQPIFRQSQDKSGAVQSMSVRDSLTGGDIARLRRRSLSPASVLTDGSGGAFETCRS